MIFNSKKNIGIVSYGAKLPKLKILGETIAFSQGKSEQKIYKSLGVESKSVPNIDEDVITLSTEAGNQAIERLQCLSPNRKDSVSISYVTQNIGAVFIGSESHPYAVKPSGTVVAQALGIASDSMNSGSNEITNFVPNFGEHNDVLFDQKSGFKIKPLAVSDLQFACKAGTQAMQICCLYAQSGFCEYTLAIGADTAQAKPGDVLEYTAGAGAAAFILGTGLIEQEKNLNKSKTVVQKKRAQNNILARLVATTSVATDTPDFWRRPYQPYPEHAGRFTAEPGYFTHIKMAAKLIMKETGLTPTDFEYCVFHTPNAKFPLQVAKELGFSYKQIENSLLVTQIGNTYAGASMLGLAATLDIAKPDKKILVVSYGSGSGSDAFVFETTEFLSEAREKWKTEKNVVSKSLFKQIKLLNEVTYQEYLMNSKH